MKVLLVRHAKSFYDWPKYPTDSVRPLSEKGRTRQKAVAKGMKVNNLSFDMVWCSPYKRALETLEIIQMAFNTKLKVIINNNLVPGGDEHELYELLQHEAEQHSDQTLLLVSHNPLVSDLLELLSNSELHDDMKTSDVALCEITSETSRLIKYFPRKLLMKN